MFCVQENLSGGVVGDVVAELRNLGVRVPPDPQLELVSVFDANLSACS